MSLRSLMQANDPAAYRLVDPSAMLRREAIPYLRGSIPELKGAGDDAIAAWIHAHAEPAK